MQQPHSYADKILCKQQVDYNDPTILKDRLATAIQNYAGRYDSIMHVDTDYMMAMA